MKLLGINSVYHELAAAVVVDGRVVSAVEEERITRVKHGKAARVDNPQVLPLKAIELCLRSAGIRADELDAICYSFDPALRVKTFRLDPQSQEGNWGDAAGEAKFLDALAQVPQAVSQALARDVRGCFHWVPHHLAHAASTFYPSGTDEAAILVVDGIGEHASTVIARGRGKSISVLAHLEFPDSLGFLWEKMSEYLGFSEYDACKVMGLAGYGDPAVARRAFDSFAQLKDRAFQLNPAILEFRSGRFDKIEHELGLRRLAGSPIGRREMNTAAALQDYTNRAMLALAHFAKDLVPTDVLCMAGGVALNCTSNWEVKERGPFPRIYIPSAPHDAGTAYGAALYVYHERMQGTRVPAAMPVPFAGPHYSDEEVLAALAKEGIASRRSSDIAADVAALVAQGKVVGWFQGAMEFGPRALGNRSLVADPRLPDIREMMNVKVKHRESFRPFAPSVIEERSNEWFEIGRASASYSYMLFACPVKADKRARIPAVVHVDGTSRVQVVAARENPGFHRMISEFERLTGVPLVLNTSFNDSEPIVCSPAHALATFRSTRIDALALGDQLVTREAL